MRKKNNKQNKMLAVREIMKEYNLTYQTINHYADFGLLPVALKKGNVRFYDKNIVGGAPEEDKKIDRGGAFFAFDSQTINWNLK